MRLRIARKLVKSGRPCAAALRRLARYERLGPAHEVYRATMHLSRHPTKEGWISLRKKIIEIEFRGVDYEQELASWAATAPHETGIPNISALSQRLEWCADRWNHPFKVWIIDQFWTMENSSRTMENSSRTMIHGPPRATE